MRTSFSLAQAISALRPPYFAIFLDGAMPSAATAAAAVALHFVRVPPTTVFFFLFLNEVALSKSFLLGKFCEKPEQMPGCLLALSLLPPSARGIQ